METIIVTILVGKEKQHGGDMQCGHSGTHTHPVESSGWVRIPLMSVCVCSRSCSGKVVQLFWKAHASLGCCNTRHNNCSTSISMFLWTWEAFISIHNEITLIVESYYRVKWTKIELQIALASKSVRMLWYSKNNWNRFVVSLPEVYLCFGEVSWCPDFMVEGGHGLTRFDPQRLISVGIISIYLLKYLPCQVIHSLWNVKRKKIWKKKIKTMGACVF